MKTTHYTSKSLESDVATINAKLDKLNAPLRCVVGGRNGYTAIDLATPEQMARHCCQRMLIGGTPRECLAAANGYLASVV